MGGLWVVGISSVLLSLIGASMGTMARSDENTLGGSRL